MGQANYTGELEQDVLNAVVKQLNKVDDLRNLIDCPKDADFLGYLVFNGESESFLYRKASSKDRKVRNFSKVPHHAFRFISYAEANQQTRRENGESIVALFDLGTDQLLVAQIRDEGEGDYAVH